MEQRWDDLRPWGLCPKLRAAYYVATGAPTDGSAWLTDDENASHVVRGGSWIYVPRNCRSAFREHCAPDFRINSIGF